MAGGKALRRFTTHNPVGNPWILAAEHPAMVRMRTRYPATVVDPAERARVLKSGINSRKIGSRVTKGRWKGMPIFTLTLEERATCPATCRVLDRCYGNKMHWAHRFRSGGPLIDALGTELADLQRRYPGGFVVRLHILGDFWSVQYVRWWHLWLNLYPALRVFGYTARRPGADRIGSELASMGRLWDRFSIRYSDHAHGPGPHAITVAEAAAAPPGSIVCPAQTGAAACCGTCGLCWQTRKTIAFLEH